MSDDGILTFSFRVIPFKKIHTQNVSRALKTIKPFDSKETTLSEKSSG